MFNFSLQPLLKHRKQLEEKQMLEFADTKRRFDHEKDTLRKLRREKVEMLFRLEKMGASKLSAADASNYLFYISRLQDEENCREEIICKIEKGLEDKRAELVTASKKKRILEIIKEKKLKEYRLSLISREQKELDESWLLSSRFLKPGR